MNKLLLGLAVLPFMAGVTMAGQPTVLGDSQMDKVTAGGTTVIFSPGGVAPVGEPIGPYSWITISPSLPGSDGLRLTFAISSVTPANSAFPVIIAGPTAGYPF